MGKIQIIRFTFYRHMHDRLKEKSKDGEWSSWDLFGFSVYRWQKEALSLVGPPP